MKNVMRKRKWQNRLLAGLLSVTMVLPAPAAYAKEAPKEQPGEGKKQQEATEQQPKELKEQEEVTEQREMQPEFGEWKEEIKDTAVQSLPEVQKTEEVPRAASAAEDFSYTELEDGTLEITEYKGAGGAVEIPGEIEGKRVTSIGWGTFSECSSLTSIEIPEGVTNIGHVAFYECKGLKSVKILGSVSIGDETFYNCSGLTSIKLPGSVTSIGRRAFWGCRGLKSIHFPKGLKSIGEDAFHACRRLESIYLPEGLTSIEPGTFYQCNSLTSITLPKGVKSIGRAAFEKCYSLESITLQEGLTSIGEKAFQQCESLTSIVLPKGVEQICNRAFLGCKNLKSIKLPEGLKSIDDMAFIQCHSLESITLPKSLKIIGKRVFGAYGSIIVRCYKNSVGYKYVVDAEMPYHLIDEQRPNGPDVHTYKKIVIPARIEEDGMIAEKCSCGKTKKGVIVIAYIEKTNLSKTQYTYNGKVQKPSVTVKDRTGKIVASSNYAVSYAGECKNAGTYTVIVKFKNNYSGTGTVKKTFKIQPKKISSEKVRLAKTKYIYNGKIKKPSVIVKDRKGKKIASSNYKVSYTKGCKNVGTYTVAVKFKNNYSGTVKKTFTICPKGTSVSKLTAEKKGFTVKWKKQSVQTSGYEIQYSMDSKFKKGNKVKNVKKNKTTSQKIAKLKAGKKYYVRIRTYKTVKVSGKSKKIYSDWSKAKSVKTKR